MRMQKDLADEFPDGGILFGEGFGAGIQKGGGKYQDFQSFILFDVRVGDWWLEWPDVLDVGKALNLVTVPVVGRQTLNSAIEFVSAGFDSMYGGFPAEGIVAVPSVPLFNRMGRRVITKIKTKDFLWAVTKADIE